jgi:hypothetical protein
MATKKAAAKGKSFGKWIRSSPKQRTRIKTTFEHKTVFIIMAFKGRQKAYSVIKDECQKRKLKAIRADEIAGAGLVIQEIFDSIEQAEFIICDLTRGRPNVYYELGYAHGVGNYPDNILLLAKAGTERHFDISPLRFEEYRSTEELRSIVASRLKEWVRASKVPRGNAPNKSLKPTAR